jgi:WD40 repeat protein/energy-coupling factor transporter ATP-binding protein EcfA2
VESNEQDTTMSSEAASDATFSLDLFSSSLVSSYVDDRRFVPRAWLLDRVTEAWQRDDARFVLLTGEPGSGKSALMAHLARLHPEATRHFIRRDSITPLQGGDARTLLFSVGYQLAQLHPDLFDPKRLEAVVNLRAGRIAAGGRAVGIEAEDLRVSPFYQTSLRVHARGDVVEGELIGISASTVTLEPRLLELSNLQYLALLDPAEALAEQDPAAHIVVLIDALDEIRWGPSGESIIDWLIACPQLPSTVRFILSSRPDPDLLQAFRRAKAAEITEVVIDPDAKEDEAYIDEDLGRFLGQFTVEPAVANALNVHGVDPLSFVEQATGRASGNFQYAVALIRGIDQALGTDPPGEDLPALLRLEGIPAGTTELYRFFLERIKERADRTPVKVSPGPLAEPEDHAAWETLYRPVLAVLAVALEPLPPEHIGTYAAVPPGSLPRALEELEQFLDRLPDGTYRLYHATFPEFLTGQASAGAADPFHVDPGAWHGLLAGRLIRANPDWLACTDRYALAHTPAHLTEGLQLRTDEEGRKQLAVTLTDLLSTFEFLEAKAAGLGIDAVLDDLRAGTGLLAEEGGAPSELGVWLRLLDSQAHHLRGWDRSMDPAFFAQQVHIQAGESAAGDLADRAANRLALFSRPYLTPAWRAGWDVGPAKRTLSGHSDIVHAVAITPDGRRVVSGSDDHTLKVWDIETGRELRTLTGHTDWVHAVAVTGDGVFAVSGSFDSTLKVWELETGRLVATLAGHQSLVNGVAVSADGRVAVSGSQDSTLRVWDLAQQRQVQVHLLTDNRGEIKAVALTPDARYALCGGGVLTLWDLSTGEVVRSIDVGGGWVEAVAISHDGRCAVSGEQELTAWDLETGQPLRTFNGHTSWVNGIALDPQGARMITGSSDGTLKVWDFETGNLLRTLALGAGVACVAVSPDGRTAVSGGWDLAVTIWDLKAAPAEHAPAGHREAVEGLVVTQDGRWTVSASQDHTLKVWELATGKEQRTLHGHKGWITALALIPQQAQVVSGDVEGVLIVWDLQTGARLRTLNAHDQAVQAVAVFSDARRAVSGSNDQTIKVWDLETGRLLQTLTSRKAEVTAAAMTQDGRHAVLALSDGTFTVWNLETDSSVHTVAGQPLLEEVVAALPERDRAIITSGMPQPPENVVSAIRRAAGRTGRGNAIGAVAATPDNTRAASAAANGTLTIWTLTAGHAVRSAQETYRSVAAVAITVDGSRVLYATPEGTVGIWDVQSDGVNQIYGALEETPGTVTVTPDGTRIVSGSWTGSLRVWDLDTSKETHILGGHEAGVNTVVALPDSRRALSAAADATLRLWDLEIGRELRTLTGHRAAVTAATTCLSGRRAISASADGTLRVWDLDTGKSNVVAAPDGHIRSLAASPDGGMIVVGDGAGNLNALRYISPAPY